MTRFRDLRAADADRTKKGNLRKNAKALLDSAAAQGIPPATPYRPVTGVDERGFSKADHNGGAHWRGHLNARPFRMRELRRANRFGSHGEKPLRSRIQRLHRRQRTGGVK